MSDRFPFGPNEPRRDSFARMRLVDDMPEDFRALVHDFGWHVYFLWCHGHEPQEIARRMLKDRENVQRQKLKGRREMPWRNRPRQISDLFCEHPSRYFRPAGSAA